MDLGTSLSFSAIIPKTYAKKNIIGDFIALKNSNYIGIYKDSKIIIYLYKIDIYMHLNRLKTIEIS